MQDETNILSVRKRFELGPLPKGDAQTLKLLIFSDTDEGILSEAIYFYTYSFAFDPEISQFIEGIIESSDNDELLAVSLKGLFRYWIDGNLDCCYLIDIVVARLDFEDFFETFQIISWILNERYCQAISESAVHKVLMFRRWAVSLGFDV